MTDIIVFVSLLSNLNMSHTQCNASSIYLEQTFVCKVDVRLIFKNVRRNKKAYIPNVNLTKYARKIQHPVIDLKMELLVKIVNYFKL